MADNVTIPASGNGTATPVVATDDVSGVHFQKVKLDVGADGASDPVSGSLPVDDNGGSLTVDGSVSVTGVSTLAEQQTQTTSLQSLDDLVIAEDAAHANGDKGVLPLAVRRDTAASSTPTDGDYGTLTTDASGRLRVSAADVTQPVSGTVTVTEPVSVDDNGGSLTVDAAGDVAHDAVDAGNPVKIGGKYVAAPGAVADGDRTDALSDSFGRLQVGAYLVDESGSGGTFAVAHSDLMVDGKTNSGGIYGRVLTASDLWVFNGTTWDRLRGDTLGLHVSRQATAATATLTNVNDTATSTTLLAANTSRKGASIHNDSTAVLYVKFGTTASATSFTVKMAADAHYEVPFGFTGRIDGIWASDASGAARITELT